MFPSRRAPYNLASKVTQEIFADHWRLTRGLDVVCLRLGSVYGAGQGAGLVARWARALLDSQAMRLANGGAFGADFVTGDDVARSVVAALNMGAVEAINVGSGVRSTLRAVADELLRASGAPPALLTIEPAEDSLDVGYPALDIGRASRDLDFVPTPLRLGIADLVQWLKGSQRPVSD